MLRLNIESRLPHVLLDKYNKRYWISGKYTCMST